MVASSMPNSSNCQSIGSAFITHFEVRWLSRENIFISHFRIARRCKEVFSSREGGSGRMANILSLYIWRELKREAIDGESLIFYT